MNIHRMSRNTAGEMSPKWRQSWPNVPSPQSSNMLPDAGIWTINELTTCRGSVTINPRSTGHTIPILRRHSTAGPQRRHNDIVPRLSGRASVIAFVCDKLADLLEDVNGLRSQQRSDIPPPSFLNGGMKQIYAVIVGREHWCFSRFHRHKMIVPKSLHCWEFGAYETVENSGEMMDWRNPVSPLPNCVTGVTEHLGT